jgi:glycosyltransferase involved in cell wall biosynthesis
LLKKEAYRFNQIAGKLKWCRFHAENTCLIFRKLEKMGTNVSVLVTVRNVEQYIFRSKNWLGLSQSRNKCLEHANGDYVFFTDCDCLVDERFTFHEESINSGKDRVLLCMNASDVRVSIYTYPSF